MVGDSHLLRPADKPPIKRLATLASQARCRRVEPQPLQQLPVQQVGGANALQSREQVAWQIGVAGSQLLDQALDLSPLVVRLSTADATARDRESALLGEGRKLGLGAVHQRANHDVAAVVGLQARRHRLDLAREETPDLIILDLMLPGLDGLEVCRTLRQEGEVPIIMLTALDEEVDRVVGLELGADDYVVKPFSMRELMARVKSVLRRVRNVPTPQSQLLRVGDLALDVDRHEVHFGDTPITISALEFELLHTLMRHAGQVLTREQLLDLVWNYDYHGDQRTVDTAVKDRAVHQGTVIVDLHQVCRLR